MTAGDKAIDDVGTFSRKKPGDAAMPKKLRKQIDKCIVGQWTTESTYKGEKMPGEASWRWAEGESCLIHEGHLTSQGKTDNYSGVMGWDPNAEALVLHAFGAHGAFTIRWTKFSETKWTGAGSGLYDGKPWRSPTKLELQEDWSRYEDTTLGEPWIGVATRK